MEGQLKETKLYQWLQSRDSMGKYTKAVDSIYEYAKIILPYIKNVYSTYTEHGIQHSLDVINIMYELVDKIEGISELEAIVMIYVAFLHDTGMIVTIDEKKEMREMDGAPESRIKLSKLVEKYENEDIAFQELIRPIHGIRAQKYIYEMEDSLFKILDCPVEQMKRTIANISRAHCENFQWMYEDNLSEKINIGDYELNEKYVAIVLRLADYLDFDYRRANKKIFEKLELTQLSEEEWKKNQSIFNNRKVTEERKIELHGFCDNPIIYSKLLQYISDVEKEIDDAKNMSDKFDKYHRISIDGKISNRIKTVGFEGRDLKLSLDFKAIVSLLMGENIYGDKKYGLRELLQNSIDACKVMEEIYCIEERYSYETYKPQIRLIFDKNNDIVILKDNGIGMNLEVITRYFLNVGVSFYSSDEYVMAEREYSPIGHYGIGFLSCFMLSDHVKIVTKHWDEMGEREMEIGRGCEYVRLKTNKEAHMKHGTEIFLNYTEVMGNFDDISQIINFIDENFIDCGVLIELKNLEEKNENVKKCLLKKLEVSKNLNICLSDYLNDIEVYLYSKMDAKTVGFIKEFSSCCMEGKGYYVSENLEKLIQDDGRNIKDMITDGKIKYLNIPIFTDDIFEQMYEVFDENFDEAYERYGADDYINIALYSTDDYSSNIEICDDDKVINNITFEYLTDEFYQLESVPTIPKVVERNVYDLEEIDDIILYNTNVDMTRRYWGKNSFRTYVKSIYFSNVNFLIPYLMDGIKIDSMWVNINNTNIIPNVARNDISKEQKDEISFAIGKAIHMWILDNLSLSTQQIKLLRKFIEEKYSGKNIFFKNKF